MMCCFDIYSKYASVISLKDKNGITITNPFQKTLDLSNCNTNKTWKDERSEFYKRSVITWFQDYDTKSCSAHNEGKSVFAETENLNWSLLM